MIGITPERKKKECARKGIYTEKREENRALDVCKGWVGGWPLFQNVLHLRARRLKVVQQSLDAVGHPPRVSAVGSNAAERSRSMLARLHLVVERELQTLAVLGARIGTCLRGRLSWGIKIDNRR